jgi:S-formylglutathione hydrolase FrmB
MKKITILLLTAALMPALMQCSKRENPVDSVAGPQGFFWELSFDSEAVSGDIMQSNPGRDVLVYTPPGYDEADTSTTYPVLYLLHGYGMDETLFKGVFSLGETMDELINSGEIEPMIVVTPDASNKLGGSFYTNSPEFGGQSFAGNFRDYITDEVVPLVDSAFRTIADREHRGIGGHSMGGYGAVKIGMLRNDLFGSVSSMSGLLAFMGAYPDTTNPYALGLLSLMQAMLIENSFEPGNDSSFYAIRPGPGKRLTNMMFAMAAAFSPHDPADPDTTYAHFFSVPGYAGYVDLPFDVDGDLVLSLWNLWMANDNLTLFNGGYWSVFDNNNTDLYFDCGEDDDLLFQYQARVFDEAASALISDYYYEEYSGFDDVFHADHSTYIAERVKEVVMFHDRSFNQ